MSIITPRITGTKPLFTFREGRCYTIKATSATHEGNFSTHPDAISIFKYEGKTGIFHCFREIHGGWTRTCSDAQLVGKIIEEANYV